MVDKKHKKKVNPKLRAAAAKKLLEKKMLKKKLVLGNGDATKDNDKAPIQPETNDEQKEMMEGD